MSLLISKTISKFNEYRAEWSDQKITFSNVINIFGLFIKAKGEKFLSYLTFSLSI